jgi:hypothetical protein
MKFHTVVEDETPYSYEIRTETEVTVMKFGSGFLRIEINKIFSVLHSKEPKVLDSICYMYL